MALITSDLLKTLNTEMSDAFGEGFDAYTPEWNKIAAKIPSSKDKNTYDWLAQLPTMREWIGARQIVDLKANDYTIKNKTFEQTIQVSREQIEDDEAGSAVVMARELGRTVKAFPDELVFGLLKDGFTANGYDNVPFFGTHPNDGNGYTNLQDGGVDAGAPWFLLDTSRFIRPLILQVRREPAFTALNQNSEFEFFNNVYTWGVDTRMNAGFGLPQLAYGATTELNEVNFDQAMQDMMSIKGEGGKPLGIRPKILVVGPANRAAALQVVRNQFNANGGSNKNFEVVEVLVNPYLD